VKLGLRLQHGKKSHYKKLAATEYNEEDYLAAKYENVAPSPEIKALYYKLRTALLEKFDKLEVKQRKKYVGFYSKDDGSAVCTIQIQKQKMILTYSTNDARLFPPSPFVFKYTKGHWGIGDYRSEIKNEEEISKANTFS
jgi:predicted transport protein